MVATDLQVLLSEHKTASDLYVAKVSNGYLGDKVKLMKECIEDSRLMMGLVKEMNQ